MLRFLGGRGDEVPDWINLDPGALLPACCKGLTVKFYSNEPGSWIKPKGVRNEPLDTVVYAVWASLAPAVKADVTRESQWEELEGQYEPATDGLFDRHVSVRIGIFLVRSHQLRVSLKKRAYRRCAQLDLYGMAARSDDKAKEARNC
ncbi:terminase gpA endonuclease subunit [Xanthomonas arboricola]|nr:terminase gpA endonuclease subunit [Xanthomonas arboricola]